MCRRVPLEHSVLLFLLMFSQLIGILWSTASSNITISFVWSPSVAGTVQDRQRKRRAVQRSGHSMRSPWSTAQNHHSEKALVSSYAVVEDPTGLRTGGNRVVHREKFSVPPEICELLNATMRNVLAACEALATRTSSETRCALWTEWTARRSSVFQILCQSSPSRCGTITCLRGTPSPVPTASRA